MWWMLLEGGWGKREVGKREVGKGKWGNRGRVFVADVTRLVGVPLGLGIYLRYKKYANSPKNKLKLGCGNRRPS